VIFVIGRGPLLRISFQFLLMAATDDRRDPNAPPSVPVLDYRPVERFWPYVELSEAPSDEELAKPCSARRKGRSRSPSNSRRSTALISPG